MKRAAVLATLAAGLAVSAASARAGSVDFSNGPDAEAPSYLFTDTDGINITATATSSNTAQSPEVYWGANVTFDPVPFIVSVGGLGVDSKTNPVSSLVPQFDVNPQEINNYAFSDTLWLTFDAPVDLQSITFGRVNSDIPFPIDLSQIGLPTQESYRIVDLNGDELASGDITGTLLFPIATANFTGLNALTTFGIQAGPNSSFTVLGLTTTSATAVPLPAAAWSGLGMLGLLGAGALRKKARALLVA